MVSCLMKSLPLIVVIMTAGADGQHWGVNYSPSYVCALKGSSVTISCTVTYPQSYQLKEVFWTKPPVGELPNLCSGPEKRERVQCLSKDEDKDTSSVFTLTAVTEADKHVYYCRFTTDRASGRWTGIPGVQLDVTDLQVETRQSVKEGESVTLTCKSSCSLPEHTPFIWYRDTHTLTDQTANQLQLQSVSRSDTGFYSCAVTGQRLKSPAVYLKVGSVDGLLDRGVKYSPSYVCALKGSSVTISCTVTDPQSYQLIKAFWTKPVGESPDLCSDPEKRGRVQCWSEDGNTHSLTLTAVTEADKHVYYCGVRDYYHQKNIWTVVPGAWLDVTEGCIGIEFRRKSRGSGRFEFCCGQEWAAKKQHSGIGRLPSAMMEMSIDDVEKNLKQDLQVETHQSVKEGESVTLTCKSSCSLPEHTPFIWYRDTHTLTKGIVKGNQLQLWSVRRSDEGNYQCAVRGNERLISPAVYLKVESVDGLWDWGVNYSPSYVCALKGSSVTISCTVTDPLRYQLIKAFWTKPVGESPDLCSDPEERGGVQCSSEDGNTHSLTLTAVTEADKHVYYCRFRDYYQKKNIWTVVPGAWLDVTDLQVETPQSVKLGESVTLTCKSSCSLTEHTPFIWYRDTHTLTKGIVKVNQLQLWSVRRSDAGNYRCAVRGNEHLISPAVYLKVGYPPKSVSASVSPSVIVEGDSVTLSCSSDSNPPAVNFSWFKGRTSLGSGDTYRITNIESEASGKYECSARNKHGSQISAPVNVNVMYPPKSVSVSVSPSVIVEGDSVTLSCSSDSNPPAVNFSWFKGGSLLGSGDTYRITNIESEASGKYKCSARNKHGSQISAPVNVNVMYPPKSVSVSVSPSVIVEGDSVTLSCSSDSNPPAVNFSWIKGELIVGSGGVYSISKISSDGSGEYKCRSRNKYGEKDSDAVKINVMYAPRDVVVTLNSSGVIVEGDSVTLSCSSDSNPPAVNFSWFKEDQTSAVGSGQSFSISSFNSSFSGRFYCEAQNKYGSQRSASVSLSVKGVQRAVLHTVYGLVAGLIFIIIVIIIIIVFIKRKKRREGGTEDVNQKQTADASDDTYTALDPASRTSADIYSTIPGVQSRAPDGIYTALELQSRSSEYETLAVTSADPH
ncbi:vascular cell adhesion protein 1-like [Pseudorasbora parva]|uniref:vascular cell adhesion protein 1-like n=1 Tax=Pseudorasbora parva TaxID=51549 RepID=UPI00351F74C7